MTDLETRLRTWGRVVRDHGPPQRSAGSFEGRYRSPQYSHWEGAEAPRQIADPLLAREIQDAWVVEAAWRTLSPQHQFTLRVRYCWIHGAIARRSKTKGAITDESLLLAQAAILAALGRPVLQNRNICRTIVQKLLALVSKTTYNDGTVSS